MKDFSIQDLICYNTPCFVCGNTPKIFIKSYNQNNQSLNSISYLLKEDIIQLTLNYNYFSNCFIKIHLKTNKIINYNNIKQYLEYHDIYFNIDCKRCHSIINSQFLDFDFETMCLKPLSLYDEIIKVINCELSLNIHMNYDENKSVIDYKTFDSKEVIQLTTHLINKSKLRDVDHLLSKVKSYIIFS